MSDLSLRYLLFGDDVSASKSIRGVGDESEKTAGRAGKKFTEFGGMVAAGAVAAGLASIKMAGDYEQATTLLVTGAGESEKNIAMVRKGLLDMAPAVGIGPVALAKAMFMVESAGYHGAEGLIVMKAAAEGAKIGGADATVVANGLTTALTDYKLPASDAALVTSKLVATVAAGKTNMGDLAGSLAGILPFASSFNVSLNDITGAMATMTGEGIDAATTATMLKFTMMSMANETPKGRDALKSIGMTAQQLKNDLSSQGVGGALQTVINQIGKHFPKGSVAATAALSSIVGGTRGMGSALALTNTHFGTLNANIASISKAVPEADGHVKGWATTTKDFNFKLEQLKEVIQVIAIKIGDVLIPVVMKGVTWFQKHQDVAKVLAGVIAGVLVAAVILWTVHMAMAGVAVIAATWPVLLIIAAIAALAAGLIYCWTHFETFRTVVTDVFHGVQVVIGYVVASIIGFFKGMFDVVMWVIGGIVHVASLIPGPWQSAMRNADKAVQGFKAGVDQKMGAMAASAGGWGQQTGSNYAGGLNSRKAAAQAVAASVGGAVRYGLSVNAYSMGAAVGASYAGGISGSSALAVMAAQGVAGRAQAAMAAALAPPHRAAGGPVMAGHMYTVNEHGQETFVPSQNGFILPHGSSGSGGSSGGGGGSAQPIVIQMVLDGRVLHQSLLALKRTNGGGLALG